ncbi:MAG: dTDP-glucose 4,6-dehydratase [Firmicutes bacterium]|nr:dTDP-glucose 4,6-dehydratase [Bacillota bacterium]
MRVLLVTGGAGFIGSNFIQYVLKTGRDYLVVNYDNLTYAGNLKNLKEVEAHPSYHFIKGDICDPGQINWTLNGYKPDYIVNFAAESHVDRSISGPMVFGETNFIGTLNLLQSAYKFWGEHGFADKRFLQVSTDEVYGSIENDRDCFKEESNLMPNSPYSASKAGADLMVRAFSKTYGFPAIVTRSCNNYGQYQHREKFIPTCITKALNDEPIPIYGDGTNVREWIHVLDNCAAVAKALLCGTPGEVYNIGSGEEVSNIAMARMILNFFGKPEDMIVKVDDRPGHDWRYALDSSKARTQLKWSCSYKLAEGIKETIEWYKNNLTW